jgi:MOSC domain-containing protein YiiM
MKLTQRTHPEFTVQRAHAIMHAKPRNGGNDLTLARCESLSLSWREQLENRATKGKVKSQSARLFGADDPPNIT